MNVVTQFSTYTHFNALNLLILNAILWSMMTLSRFGDISILIRFDWLIFRKKTFDPTWSHTKLLFIFFFSLLCILRMNKWNHLQWMFCYCFYHIKTVMGCFVLFFAITSFVQMRSIYFSKKNISTLFSFCFVKIGNCCRNKLKMNKNTKRKSVRPHPIDSIRELIKCKWIKLLRS